MHFNYYQILGVSISASQEEIKLQYKELAKKYHPDKNIEQELYSEHFKKISEAYSILSKPEKRKKYDLKLMYSVRAEEKPQAQNTHNHNFPHQNYPHRVKKKQPFLRKSEYKLFAICAGGLSVLVIGLIFFNSYMNQYTAETYFQEGLELEHQKVMIAALQKYSEAIGFNKEHSGAYTKRGILRAQLLGDNEGGLSDLNLAIRYAENSPAEIYFERGKLFLSLEKMPEALKDFETSASLKPKSDSAFFFAAEIYNYTNKNYEKAIANYSKAISNDPRCYDCLFGRGFALQKLNKYEPSLVDFSKAIELTPEKGYFYFYRGITKLVLQDTLGACVDWDQAKSQGFRDAEAQIKKYCADQLK